MNTYYIKMKRELNEKEAHQIMMFLIKKFPKDHVELSNYLNSPEGALKEKSNKAIYCQNPLDTEIRELKLALISEEELGLPKICYSKLQGMKEALDAVEEKINWTKYSYEIVFYVLDKLKKIHRKDRDLLDEIENALQEVNTWHHNNETISAWKERLK